MIIGIGTDIVKISRICPAALPLDDPFFIRSFTEKEIEQSKERVDFRFFFATRFAGKEAVYKAISFCKTEFNPKDIEITDDDDGKPFASLTGKTLLALSAFIDGNIELNLSLSYEKEYALAFAVAEGRLRR